MALLVSLGRDLPELNLGEHEFVDLQYDRLTDAQGRVLAQHRRNRWIHDASGKEYVKLSMLGPLITCHPMDEANRLGPYEALSMYNGVGYVEQRVFSFTDLQQKDWYVMNAGQHWPAIRVRMHVTGP